MEQNLQRSWGIILQQAWALCLNDKLSVTRQNFDNTSRGTPKEKKPKPCYCFNRGKCNYGNNCKFEHRCLACAKYGHGSHNCRRLLGAEGADWNGKKDQKTDLNRLIVVYVTDQGVSFHTNFDLETIFTPVDPMKLEHLLRLTNYPTEERLYLVDGFTIGFDFHYKSPHNRQDRSENLPFRKVGSRLDLWEKVMKEVKEKRFAGSYEAIPYANYIQSPMGLVPKPNNETRLIFHLSYDFKHFKSFNHYIPDELCTVKYRDLDYTIRTCLKWCHKDDEGNEVVYLGKGDVWSAFTVLPGKPSGWKWTVLKAIHPITGRTYFLVDKNLPLGAGISCAIFQRFSNCIAHMVETFTNGPMSCTNYLDDYLYVAPTADECNHLVRTFIALASQIGLTMAEEKTEWATTWLTFLGILLLGDQFVLSIPDDKRVRVLNAAKILSSKSKATIHELQQFTGFLNFLGKAIFPGRAFTRQMYAKIPWHNNEGKELRQHHHVRVDQEFCKDCQVWIQFLGSQDKEVPISVCRPFVDFTVQLTAQELDLYTDSSVNQRLGFGGYFGKRWFAGVWKPGFIAKFKPSIDYLELYAITVAIILWAPLLSNCRVVLITDNNTAKNVLKNNSSSCRNSMVLVRKIVLTELKYNVRFFARHVEGSKND